MKISVETALEILDKYPDQVSLSEVQEMVFRQTWEGHSYQEIAKNSGYQLSYIRDIGYRLWQLLSTVLGQKITKNNVQRILKQKWLLNSKYPEINSSKTIELFNHPLENKASVSQISWGEVIDVSACSGRHTETKALQKWIVQDRCRLVTILGTFGIGKTTLAAITAESIQQHFQYSIWRSLRNAQSITDLLTEIILFVSHDNQALPSSVDGLISRLMRYLTEHRCLLILDNYESILQSQTRAGRYYCDCEGYAQLLQRIADERHQSCVIITTREKPIGITALESDCSPVRSLYIKGLSPEAAQEVIKARNLDFTKDESEKLIESYAGNPLMLKLAAASIQSLFGGSISNFLQQKTVVFGDIWDLVDQQFNRLSVVEKLLMHWLFVNQERSRVWQSLESSFPQISRRELLEALQSLQQRSLLEIDSLAFTQPAVMKEYMAELVKYTNELDTLKLVKVS